MLKFDKSIHPVVLYEYFLVLIFMKIHENLKNEGKHVKTISLGEGLIRSILHSYGLLYSCQIVQWDPQNVRRSSL